MKGLILASAFLFAVVSAAPKLTDIEKETMMLECMLDNYGKDPRDMSLNHNETQIMSCFFHCDLSLGGAIYEDGTLNVPFLEEIMAEKIATSDFPVLELFIKVYYECKRDYPDHCDWFICANRKWPQSGEKGILDEISLKKIN
ncbi:hypothetical protein TKK_0007456 [Trichogramma kaykai]